MLKEQITLLSGLLTPIVGIVAVYIAWQQWRTNHLKVKHDLYERRLAVYLSVMEFLSTILREAKASDVQVATFMQKTRESCFLFSDEITKHLDAIYHHWVDLNYCNTMLHESNLPIGDKRTELAHKDAELLKWFGAQFEITKRNFIPYMKLY